MKINFDSHILNEQDEATEGLTLGSASAAALLIADEKTAPEEKATAYAIWSKIKKGGEVDLTPEEVVTIKRQLGKVGSTLLYGRACDILNG